MTPEPGNNQNMTPDEQKRMFIFFVLAIMIYMGFNHFILEPQNEAMRAAAQHKAAIEQQISENPQIAEPLAPKPKEEIITRAERITINNGTINGSLSPIGARLDDIELNNYFETLDKKKNVTLFSPNGTELPRYAEYGWVSPDNETPVPDKNTTWRIKGNNVNLSPQTPVTLSWDNGQGLTFERTITLDSDSMFTITQNVINNMGRKITLYPYGLISQTGIPKDFKKNWLLHEGPIGFIGESLSEISYEDVGKKLKIKQDATKGWIGITEKYWLMSLIPPQGQNVKYNVQFGGQKGDKGRYQTDFVAAPLILEPGQSGQVKSNLFAGAKRVIVLSDYSKDLNIPKFDLAVNFGWFWFLSKPFFYGLHYIGAAIGNMGFAIILLTILIRGSVFPLTNASYKSFGKMKKVAPQMTELREKHGEDKQKLQQEMMQLYQKEGVNPLAGCFPILLQIPIFFALYKVLFVTIEIRHAPFFGWIQDLAAPDPTSIFNLFGTIPWDPPGFMMIGVWPCIMCVAMVIQKKLNPPPQDKIQRDMMNIFPFFITYILAQFASGLVIYWTFSAIIGIVQQMIIMRSMGVPIYLFGQSEEEKSKE